MNICFQRKHPNKYSCFNIHTDGTATYCEYTHSNVPNFYDFIYTEEQFVKFITKNPFILQFIPNPSKKVQLEAIRIANYNDFLYEFLDPDIQSQAENERIIKNIII